MSYYVKRQTSYGHGWTGPIRSAAQAQREREAWESFGTPAEVLESSPEIRVQVRTWQRERKAARS